MTDCQTHFKNNRHFAIILAAGFSTRMGVCKTTLPWHNGQSLLRYQAEQFLLAGITPIVVLGSHNAHRRCDCPPGSQIIINFNSYLGKTTSILAGLNALPQDFSSVIISAVDQPRSSYIYQTLLRVYQEKQSAIVAPCDRNKLGHPLLFSARLLPSLKNISDSSMGLRKIVRELHYQIEKVNVSTSEILIDINNKNTYKLLKSKIYRFPDNLKILHLQKQ